MYWPRHLNYRRSEENDRAWPWSGCATAARPMRPYFELAREPEKKADHPYPGPAAGHLGRARDYRRWNDLCLGLAGGLLSSRGHARPGESMDSLARFPVDLLRKSATKKRVAGSTCLVEAIQSLHLGRPDYETRDDRILRARFDMRSASDWIMYITMGKFEDHGCPDPKYWIWTLTRSWPSNLGSHRRYYERHTPENIAPVDSWIAIALLGMACMAHDKGEPVTVESDYIPRFLIEGTYLF